MENTKKKIKKTFVHKNCLSSGNLFLDRILGGFSLGSNVLLVQDNYSSIYLNFIQSFLSEGLVKGNKCFLFNNNNDLLNSDIIDHIPYKTTQVESILNSKSIKSNDESGSMKIAWRYENIKYSNIIEDITQSAEYTFDISRQLQKEYLSQLTVKKISTLNDDDDILKSLDEYLKLIISSIQGIQQQYDENEELTLEMIEKQKNRIVIPCLITNNDSLNYNQHELIKIKSRMMALKNIARSNNGVIFSTVDYSIFENVKLKNIFYNNFDYVLKINSFTMSDEKIEDYNGILKIEKIPKLNSFKMVMHSLDTDTYGVIMDKRKMIIEQVDLGPEIDRNTKVKENKENKEIISIKEI